jgi:hypothetical protein
MTAWKCGLESRKVVGTLEGLHYDETIWKTMSREQRDKVLSLFQAKSSTRVAKAAKTSLSAAPLSEVSDKIESLSRTVKSLESNRDGDHWSSDHQPSSCRCKSHSWSRSSSRSPDANQSGLQWGCHHS